MAFTNNFRIERIYFEKLKSNIDILKSYIEAGATGEALELLKNSVDVDGAVLLLYRNLGEAWAELADLIQKTQKGLKDLEEKTEAYHDELNERIDEVNNYLMALIRELDARIQAVEQDLATMKRNKFYDLVENNGSYNIEKDGETVSFDDIKADADFPHDVILRYDNGTSVTELEIREYTDSRIDFYSIGLANSDKTVKEILVSIADTEAVTYSENTLENPLYTFGTGLSLDSDNELSVDFNTVQGKLTEGTGIDIDSNNEISVDTSVIQEKLTEGTGIDINSNNEISVDTSVIQEKLTAGNNISITNNVISATDTIYSEGTGIDIDSNNVISADTSVLQEKLVAGSGIAIDPNTNEISNTSQGATYTAGDGINIDSNNMVENSALLKYKTQNFVTGGQLTALLPDSYNDPQDYSIRGFYKNYQNVSLNYQALKGNIEFNPNVNVKLTNGYAIIIFDIELQITDKSPTPLVGSSGILRIGTEGTTVLGIPDKGGIFYTSGIKTSNETKTGTIQLRINCAILPYTTDSNNDIKSKLETYLSGLYFRIYGIN